VRINYTGQPMFDGSVTIVGGSWQFHFKNGTSLHVGDNRALYHRKLRSEQAAIRKNVDEFVKRYPVRLGVR